MKRYILIFILLLLGFIANAEEFSQTTKLNKAQLTFSNKLTPPDSYNYKPVLLPIIGTELASMALVGMSSSLI